MSVGKVGCPATYPASNKKNVDERQSVITILLPPFNHSNHYCRKLYYHQLTIRHKKIEADNQIKEKHSTKSSYVKTIVRVTLCTQCAFKTEFTLTFVKKI